MKLSSIFALNKAPVARKWIIAFLGIQLAILIGQIVKRYARYDIKNLLVSGHIDDCKITGCAHLFSRVTWGALHAWPTWELFFYNMLLVLLSFWATPLIRKKNFSFMSAGCYGYLLFVSLLSLLDYGIIYLTGHYYPVVNILFPGILLIAGIFNARAIRERLSLPRAVDHEKKQPGVRIYYLLAFAIGLSMTPFLIFPYYTYDAVQVYALKAFALQSTGNASSFCLGDGSFYPPLFPIMLTIGIGDQLFQGRLIPFFMFVAFMVVFLRMVPRKGFIDRSLGAALFLTTTIVWLCVVSNISNIPFMTLLGAAGFLLIDSRSNAGSGKNGIETVAAIILLGAATLVRQDGAITIIALLAGIFLSEPDKSKRFRRYAVAAVVVLALSSSWELRPGWLRGAAGYLQTQDAAQAAFMGAGFHFSTVLHFLYAAQGLYLSHYGFGIFFYALAVALIAGIRKKIVMTDEVRPFVLAGAACIAAIVIEYLAFGLFLRNGMEYYVQVQLSYARSTMHFFPFLLLLFITIVNILFPSSETAGPASAGNL